MRSPAGDRPDEARLADSLRDWLGRWPPESSLDVVGSPLRVEPGWDGRVHAAVGVASPEAMVLSVPPDRVDQVAELAPAGLVDGTRLRAGLGAAVGRPRRRCVEWVFRWSTAPAALPEAGVWVAADAIGVPAWLRPFGGEVLVAVDDAGHHLGGVGIKRHTPLTHELAVVVAHQARGQGLGRRLVAQAARRILDGGAVALYIHARVNVGSGRLADAAGFPDRGWHMYELADEPPPLPTLLARRGRALLREWATRRPPLAPPRRSN